MSKQFILRGLIVLFAIAILSAILFTLFGYFYRETENRNFAELRKKAELDCTTMPYHCAVKENDTEKINTLKASGADINSRDRFGNTPLLYAISWNAAVIGRLLELGADPNIPNEQGLTPLEQSLNLNDFSLAEQLIVHGANLNAKAEGDTKKYLTILNRYITERNVATTSFLVAHGASLSLKDGYGYTACERAVMYENMTLFPFCENNTPIKDPKASGSVYQSDALGIKAVLPPGWIAIENPTNTQIKTSVVTFGISQSVASTITFVSMQLVLDRNANLKGSTLRDWLANQLNKPNLLMHETTIDGVVAIDISDDFLDKTRHRYFIDLGSKGILSITFFASPDFDADYTSILNSLIFTQKEG